MLPVAFVPGEAFDVEVWQGVVEGGKAFETVDSVGFGFPERRAVRGVPGGGWEVGKGRGNIPFCVEPLDLVFAEVAVVEVVDVYAGDEDLNADLVGEG